MEQDLNKQAGGNSGGPARREAPEAPSAASAPRTPSAGYPGGATSSPSSGTPSTAGGTSQQYHSSLDPSDEQDRVPISDGDMVFDSDAATVDRMAANHLTPGMRRRDKPDPNASDSNPYARKGAKDEDHAHDHAEAGGWGFRIRKFLLR